MPDFEAFKTVFSSYSRLFRGNIFPRVMVYSLVFFLLYEGVSMLYGFLYGFFNSLFFEGTGGITYDSIFTNNLVSFLLFAFIWPVLFPPIAISAHRNFILLEDYAKNPLKTFRSDSWGLFSKKILLIVLISFIPIKVSGFFLQQARNGVLDVSISGLLLLSLGVLVALGWLAYSIRFWLVLPAAAVNQQISLRESMAISSEFSGRLAGAIILLVNVPYGIFTKILGQFYLTENILVLYFLDYMNVLVLVFYFTVIAFVLSAAYKTIIGSIEDVFS